MSDTLYRVGRWAYGHHRIVIAAVALLVIQLVAGLVASPPNTTTELRIDGVPAQQVVDRLAEDLPAAAGGQGQIVFVATGDDLLDAGPAAQGIAEAAARIYAADQVTDVRQLATSPSATLPPGTMVLDGVPVPGVVVAEDGRTALFQFPFDRPVTDLDESEIDGVVDLATDAVAGQDVRVLPGATLQSVPELVGVGELVGLSVAALVLLVTLGSVVAAGLPLLTAVTGVLLGVGAALSLTSVLDITSLSLVLALMLGLAVGIDYALFIVNRHRRFILDDGFAADEAAARAVATSGSAVLFAGATVIIALLALAVVGIDLLTTMAVIAAATVAVTVVLALVLLPALLGLVGERVCSGRARAAARDGGNRHRVASRWAHLVTGRPTATVLGVVLVGALLALPASHLSLGMPSGEAYPVGSDQRDGYDAVADAFGEGVNGPLLVAVSADEPLATATLDGTVQRMGSVDGVASVTLAAVSEDGRTAAFAVVPDAGPDEPATADLVGALRHLDGTTVADQPVEVGVTGLTAMGIDISDRMADVLPTYLLVVIGLSLLLLGVVFRSVVVPLTATAGFVLSILASLGVTTLVFGDGWFSGILGVSAGVPVVSLLPVLVTGVLYGLAMDYQVFLVSAMREAHSHGRQGVDAVVAGFTSSSRVVVAAAVIMTAVFAGFVFNADPMIQQFGLALSVGVAFDAFVVRMTLVPALMAMVGDRAWWLPERIDHALPDLDIEGRGIAARAAEHTGA